MKLRDLIRLFEKNDWTFKRTSGHIIYKKGELTAKIPHHREVNEMLAKSLIKKYGLK